jgi:protein-S-isoprenylcysteine O-methyltransferase
MRTSPIVALPYGPAAFYGSLLAIFLLDIRRTAGAAPEGEVEHDRGTSHLIRRLGFAALLLAIVAAYAIPQATLPIDPVVALAAGLALQWSGYLVVEWTTRLLGRMYRPVVAVQRDHRIVRRGPYRVIRHPMYAASLVMDVGAGLALANAISIALLLGLSGYAYARRIGAKERVMLDELGEPYREYVQGTKRLIPFLW